MGRDIEQPFRLPVLGELDIDAELARFEEEERAKLGLKVDTEHWFDQMVDPQFTKSERATTTLLVSGLTAAHDYLVKAALRGIGYKVEVIDCPTTTPCATARSSATAGSATPPTSPSATW
jgi:hypothetical protein